MRNKKIEAVNELTKRFEALKLLKQKQRQKTCEGYEKREGRGSE